MAAAELRHQRRRARVWATLFWVWFAYSSIALIGARPEADKPCPHVKTVEMPL